MEFNKHKFSLAFAATMGIVYVACALLVVLAPAAAAALFGWMLHLVNLDQFVDSSSITAGGFAAGLVEILILGYLGAWIFAAIYNRLLKRS